MHHENMHKLASLRFLKLNLEYQNINMGRTYEHLSFNFYGTGIMQSSTTVVCMVAVSIGGAAIVVAMLDRGSLHLWLGGIMPSGMSSCGFGAVRYGRSRGIWGSPGFCVGWRAAVRGGGGLIAVLRDFFATGGEVFILVGGLGTGLSFYGV